MIQVPSIPSSGGFSADVRIHLHVNGSRIPVAQIGGPRMVLRERVMLAHDHGVVVMTIDGRKFRWNARFALSSTPVDAIEATLTPIEA